MHFRGDRVINESDDDISLLGLSQSMGKATYKRSKNQLKRDEKKTVRGLLETGDMCFRNDEMRKALNMYDQALNLYGYRTCHQPSMHGEVQMAFGSFTKGTILRHKARCHLHLREWQAAADASWSAMDYDHLDESSDTWATTTQLCFLKATMHLGTHVALEKASDLRFDHFDDWEIPRDNEKSTKRLRAVVRLHG